MHASAMNDLERIPGMLASLADPSRYRVVCVLAEGDYCVSEIAQRVGLSQSCTTRHLQTLQRAGVLTRTRAGKRVLFRIREGDADLSRVLALLVLRQPLSAPAGPPREPAGIDASGFTDQGVSVELPRRRSSAAVALRESTGSRTAASTPPTGDAPVASDAPSESEMEPAGVGASAAPRGTELEDFLL